MTKSAAASSRPTTSTIDDLTIGPAVHRQTLNGLHLAGLSFPIDSRYGPASWLVTRTAGQVARNDTTTPAPKWPDMPAEIDVTIAKDNAQITHFAWQTADALARWYTPGARLVRISRSRGRTGSMIDTRHYAVPPAQIERR